MARDLFASAATPAFARQSLDLFAAGAGGTPQGAFAQSGPGDIRFSPATLTPDEEPRFQDWYRDYSKRAGLDPDPDPIAHAYDYRGWWRKMQEDPIGYAPQIDPIDQKPHAPSEFKAPWHPNRVVDGVDTITGETLGPPEEPPGLVTEIGKGLARGAFSALPEMVGGALKFTGTTLDRLDMDDGGNIARELGESISRYAEKVKQKYPWLKPSQEAERQQQEGAFGARGAIAEGAEMVAPSMGLPLAGAAVGTAVLPGVGTAIGGGIGMLLNLPLFFGSQAQSTYERGFEVLKARGKTDREAHDIAYEAAVKTGSEEVIGETAADVVTFRLFRFLPKPAKDAIVKSVTRAWRNPMDMLRDFSIITGAQIGTEIGQAYVQTKTEAAAGIANEPTAADVSRVILPTAVMSVLTMGAGETIGTINRRRAVKTLTDPNAPTEDRVRVAQGVAKVVAEQDKDVARAFLKDAMVQIAAKKPVIVMDDASYRAVTGGAKPPPDSPAGPAPVQQEPQQQPAEARATMPFDAGDRITATIGGKPMTGTVKLAEVITAEDEGTPTSTPWARVEFDDGTVFDDAADLLGEVTHEPIRTKGGEPFKTRAAAARAIKGRSRYQVSEVEGGFELTPIVRTAPAEKDEPTPEPAETEVVTAPDGEGAMEGALDAAKTVAGEDAGAITVADVHAIADKKGIKWDNDPEFMALTKRLTGKEHLDDLTPDELSKVHQELTEETPKPETADEFRILSAINEGREIDDAGVEQGLASGYLRRRQDGTAALLPKGRRRLIELAAETVDEQAHEAATSPKNDLAQPTEGQKDAGNYKKGHAQVAGLDVSIENPAGSKRKPEWPTLKSHYGYIRGVSARAPDKEHVDVFVKPGTAADFAGDVFVVDQYKADGKTFDEPKVVIGHTDEAEARQAYQENYTKDWKGGKAITRLTMAEFKERLQDEKGFLRPLAPTAKPEQQPTPPVTESQVPVQPGDAGAAPGPEGGLPEGGKAGVRRVLAADAASVSEEGFDAMIAEVQTARATAKARMIPTRQGMMVQPIDDAGNDIGKPFLAGSRPKQETKTAPSLAAVGKHAALGTSAAFKGLDALFGRKGTLGSGLAFDEETWAKARPLFNEAYREFVEAGKALRDFLNYIIEAHGNSAIPYLKRWHAELKAAAAAETRPEANTSYEAGERWWDRELTKAGRIQVSKLAGFVRAGYTMTSAAAWRYLPPKERMKVLAIRGTANDPAISDGWPKAEIPVTPQVDAIPETAPIGANAIGKAADALIDAANALKAAAKPEAEGYTGGEVQDDARIRSEKPDRRGAKALEGAPSSEISRPGGEQDVGEGTRRGGRPDAERHGRVQDLGDERPRSLAGEPGTASDFEGGAGPGRPVLGGDQRGVLDNVGGGRNDARSLEPGGRLTPGEPFPVTGNFVITDELGLGKGSPVQKYNDNVAAIRLLKAIEADGRQATIEEQRVLARYVGWGGIKQAFPSPSAAPAKGWERRVAEIRELLTTEEHEAAARSIQDAHYTSKAVVDGMWNIARRLGFNGGKVLESSMGVGNFFGLMPTALRSGAALTGVELDSITARIAKQLYPKANILGPVGFHEVNLADNAFNLSIGNPPFGEQVLYDPTAKHLKGFSIHNFFFAKAIDKLAPGGLHIAVVSRYFMDAQTAKVREYIAHRTELVGAIRLPWTAFSENAATEVVTDIVILKKLPEARWGTATRSLTNVTPTSVHEFSWVNTTEVPDPLGGAAMRVNSYFAAHPEMVLGQMDRSGEMRFENDITVQPREGQSIEDGLADAMHFLPENIYERGKTAEQVNAEQVAAAVPEDVIENYGVGQYFEDGDKIYQRVMTDDGSLKAVEITANTAWSEKSTWGVSRIERLRGMIGIRNAARALLRAEATDEAEKRLNAMRKTLNSGYDRFVGKHGYLNETANERVFAADPDAPLLIALEDKFEAGVSKTRAKTLGIPERKSTAKKMPIFTQRVVRPHVKVEHADSIDDGLALSISEKGKISIPYIASLTGKPEADVVDELTKGEKPKAYLDPASQSYELASDYLAGNVKRKYREAIEAGLHQQADNLKAVFPEDVTAGDLRARLGAPWIDSEAYEDFVRHLLGDGARAVIQYVKASGGFVVSIEGGIDAMRTTRWGTKRRPANDIINRIMNSRDMTVLHPEDAEGRRAVNIEETQAALDKAEEVKAEFEDWVFKDADRRERLVGFYNDHFNTNIGSEIEGSYLTLPGKVPDTVIKLRRHQLNAVARIIRRGKVLLDHVVGSGKTFTIISAVMEKRRLGLSRKPMIVVPNHLVNQWATDFYRLYPGAKVLAMRKADFAKVNRQRMLARVATGDWDAVIFSHSSFGFINDDRDIVIEAMRKQVMETQNAIDIARSVEGKKSRTAAQYQKNKESLEQRMKALLDKPKDNLLTFQELGVDDLTVDESQEFKNLFFTTQKQNVGGFGNPSGSKKALDLFVKTGWLLKTQGDRGVTFATGTPVSNSLTELFTLQRYLGMGELEARGVTSLDAWLGAFGIVQSEYESNVTGTKYKRKERLRRLTNVPEVMQLFKEFTDSVTQEQVQQNYREDNAGAEFPIPKVKSRPKSRENVVVPRTDLQKAFSTGLQSRMEKLKRGGTDNALAILGDGRKAALDMRLVDPSAQDHPGSKTHVAADNIRRIYEDWDKDLGAQLVFLDISTPLKHGMAQARRYLKAARDLLGEPNAAPYGSFGDQWNEMQGRLRERMESMEEIDKEHGIDAIERFLEQGPDIDAAVNTVDRRFSVYDDMRAKLIERGIPAGEIAFVHDFEGDAKKQELFDKVNAGRIRVLMGSTAKMGAGTNVQRKLVALHHLDAPWRPSDIEQREGRIIRQGNDFRRADENFEVEILAYATEGTSDVFFWQTQEQKLNGINSLRNFKGEREIEEVSMDAMSAAEMKALSSGNPMILEDVQLTEAVRKLEGQRRRHISSQQDIESQVLKYERAINNLPAVIARQEETLAKVRAYQEDPFDGARPTAEMDGEQMTSSQAHIHVQDVVAKAVAAAGEANAPALAVLSMLQKEGAEAFARGDIKKFNENEKQYAKQKASFDERKAVPKWTVTFAGKEYTNQETVHRAIVRDLGDLTPINLVIEGESMIRRHDIEKKIAPVIKRFADADEGEHTLGTIAGMPIDLTWVQARGERNPAGVSIEVGGEVGYVFEPKTKDGERIPVSGVTVILKIEGLISGVAYSLERNKQFLGQAQRGVDPLRAEIGKPWGKDDELNSKRDRLSFVRKELSGENAAAREKAEREKARAEMEVVEEPTDEDAGPALSRGARQSRGVTVAAARSAIESHIGKPALDALLKDDLVIAETVAEVAADMERRGSRFSGMAFSLGPVDTSSPAFKRWFKDSKVVDADGKPLVVYHGTRARVDFDTFAADSHFGTKEPANVMASNGGVYGPGRVMPVYLSIKNPKRVRDQAKIRWGQWDDAVEQAKAEGYDGLVYENEAEGFGSESWVAFRPEQIKSAIGNRGTFDPNDPSILASRATKDTGRIKGLYDDSTDTSYIITDNLSADEAWPVFLHEVGTHYGLERMLGPEKYAAVRRDVEIMTRMGSPKILAAMRQVNAAERLGLDPKSKTFAKDFADRLANSDRLLQETIAYTAQANPELPLIKRIIAAIRTFLYRLGVKLRLTENDLVQLVVASAKRASRISEMSGNVSRETAVLAARGTGDQTDTKAFRDWFKDSVVTDTGKPMSEGGKPLAVYHGTMEDFTAFDHKQTWLSKLGDSGGLGFFFSKSANEAGHYAERGRDFGVVMPAYLAIRNPKTIERYSPEYDSLYRSKQSAMQLRDDLLAQGYDGAITQIGEYVAFRPEQIKSAIGNVGAFDPENPNILASRPWYYSALTRQIEAVNMKAGSIKAWKDTLTGLVNSGKVKAEEIEAVGLKEYLDLLGGRITKEQVAEFVRANGVQVRDVVKGEEAAKFSEYQLPGGTNYTEMLLTLPLKGVRDTYSVRQTEDRYNQYGEPIVGGGWAVHNDRTGDSLGPWFDTRENAEAFAVERERDVRKGLPSGNYSSPHFDELNLLAHVRFNERTDAEGRLGGFVEEYQDDLAEKIREMAIQQAKDEGLTPKTPAFVARVTELKKIAFPEKGLPRLPFQEKTEAWLGLVIKRMIAYGAEHNWQWIAWTTGAQQVERYSGALRKAVDEIEWTKTEEGIHLVGYKNEYGGYGGEYKIVRRYDAALMRAAEQTIAENDSLGFDDVQVARRALIENSADWRDRWEVSDADAIPIQRWLDSVEVAKTKVVDTTESESALSDAIGKAMAKRIIDDPGQTGTIAGEDIRIDDTGMAGFYDRIVPNVANNVLKKLGGGRVGEVKITTPAMESDQDSVVRTERDAMLVERTGRDVVDRTFQGFDITPVMQEAAGAGLPLFSRSVEEEIEKTVGDDVDPAAGAEVVRKDLSAIRRAFLGEKPAAGVEVQRPRTQRDVPFYKQPIYTPEAIFLEHEPRLAKLHEQVSDLTGNESKWNNELRADFDELAKGMSEDQVENLGMLRFLGDALERRFSPEEIRQGYVEEDGERKWLIDEGVVPDARVAAAYTEMTRYMNKLGRFVDQHERKMRPSWRRRKGVLVRRLARSRQMQGEDFRQKYHALNDALSRYRRAEYKGSEDATTIEAEVDALETELYGALMDKDGNILDEHFQADFEELKNLDAKLQRTSVQRREGYFPHKFFGNWAVWKVGEDVNETGETKEKWELIAHEKNGFYETIDDAIAAGNAYSRNHPGERVIVKLLEFKFPNSQATELSDAAYFRFMGDVADQFSVEIGEAMAQTRDVARRRYRRRMPGFKQHRKGIPGFSKDFRKVLDAHVGDVVHYVVMDEVKYLTINAIEGLGLSPRRSTVQERPVLSAIVNNWFRDVNGQKQPAEQHIDEILAKPWARPANVGLASGLTAFMLSGGIVGNPLIGFALGSYVGYRVYSGAKGQFPSRAITGAMLEDMAHLKLGAVFNLFSPLVNLSQFVINGQTLLGPKWAAVGLSRYVKAVMDRAAGKDNSDITLMRRANIDTAYKHTEVSAHLFKREPAWKRASLFFFNTAERFNRGATYLGAYYRAIDRGATPGVAGREANKIMRRTQFDYSNVNKPELMRNVFLRVPAQFKNFVAQQMAFMFSLEKDELARFLVSLFLVAGTIGLPLVDLLDGLIDQLFGYSPLTDIKEKALLAQAEGELSGDVMTFLTRGLPGLVGTDLSARAGMGDRFIPVQLQDLKGAWWSTIENAAQFGRESATVVDQIKNLSPGLGNPLKALEAAANGIPLFENLDDPTRIARALTDEDAAVYTNPWKRGRIEYEPTTGELLLKAAGGTPMREARMRDVRDIQFRMKEERATGRRQYIDRMVSAIHDGTSDEVSAVLNEATEQGIYLTADDIRAAIKDANLPRLERLLRETPVELRPEIMELMEGANN